MSEISLADPAQADLPGLGPHIRDQIYGAIEAGCRAREAGEPRTGNPHPAHTYFHSLWQDGWRFTEI